MLLRITRRNLLSLGNAKYTFMLTQSRCFNAGIVTPTKEAPKEKSLEEQQRLVGADL